MKQIKVQLVLVLMCIFTLNAEAGFFSSITRAFSSINNILNPFSPNNPASPAFIMSHLPNPLINNDGKYPVSAHYEYFYLGKTVLIHTFNCMNGECFSIDTQHLTASNHNVFLKDQVTGADLFTQIIPGSHRLISQKDLCKAKEQSTHNPGSPCYQGLYGIHGVCHNFTERTMDAYGASMGDKFSGIENVSGNQSGRLSYMVYGRFGLPVSPAQNWSTCKAFVETKCTLEATFKSGPGVAANSIGAVGTAASAVATSARSPASVSGISRLPSYKMLQLQEY